MKMQKSKDYPSCSMDKQEHSESADHWQGSSLPPIAQIPDLESQHGDPDHPKNLINCSLYIAELSPKFDKNPLLILVITGFPIGQSALWFGSIATKI